MGPRPAAISGRGTSQQGFQYLVSNSIPCFSKLRKSHTSDQEEGEDAQRGDEKEEREKLLASLRQEIPFLGFQQLTVSRIFFWANHAVGLFGLFYLLCGRYPWGVLFFEFIYSYAGSVGTTVGAHRYWTHKAFKAKTPLRIMLMIMQTITAQYSIYKWSLDHRIHHKYTDTNMDPHNSKRGFWFSHMFWFISPKHPAHTEKLRTFDMLDLEKDPLVRFQARWYPWLVYLFYNFVPVNIVWYFWGISRWETNCINSLRWVWNTHVSSAVNSFAHIWGDKPYDKDITSTDNKLVALVSVGEGWHNYHHTFPWDYKASELGWKINFSTMFIDFFAWVGWAYDLKVVSKPMLKRRIERSGDGTHPEFGGVQERKPSVDKNEDKSPSTVVVEENDSTATWGWGDEGVSDEFRKMTMILNPLRKTEAYYDYLKQDAERDR